ncbi:MAG: UDP-N-acetylmuramoyl-tripeptide--D-alanyl-D-alanine ligase [Spirochaetes bacterium]|nr:UDP-N-acetylmuramoyl-tripeptide--D-alanyl-D-alanine ligase [Spirochaetota bacterium]
MVTKLYNVCLNLGLEFYGDQDFIIKSVSTDTRKIKDGDFFIGLKGEKFDGSEFIFEINNRVSGILINDNFFQKNREKILKSFKNIIVSKNPNRDYLRLAYYDFKKNIKIFGITGSYGKTTCKYFLYKLLSSKYKVLMNEKNYNNIIGIANTLFYFVNELNITNDVSKNEDSIYDFLILEIGTNHPGEIQEIVDIIRIDYAFITCIGNTHLEFFKNKKNIFVEKVSITKNFEKDNIFFINMDDKFLKKIFKDKSFNFRKIKIEKINRSKFKIIKKLEEINIIKEKFEDSFSSFVKINNNIVRLPFIGEHNIKNFYYCYEIAKTFIDDEMLLIENINNIELPEGRANIKVIKNEYFNNLVFIEDCYNSNPDSLKIFLNWIFSNYKNFYKIIVLGDMLELGEKSEKFHKKFLLDILFRKNSLIFYVGEMFFKIFIKNEKVFNSLSFIKKFNLEKNKKIIIKNNKIIGSYFAFFNKVDDFINFFNIFINDNKDFLNLINSERMKKLFFIKGSHGINLKKFITEIYFN